MLSFDDVKKRAKEKAAQERAGENSAGGLMDSVRERAKMKITANPNSMLTVQRWNERTKTAAKNAYDYLSAEGWKKPNSAYLQELQKLDEDSGRVLSILKAQYDGSDEYDSVMNSYRDTVDYSKYLMDSLRKSNAVFSKYKTQDEYDTAVRQYGWQQKYQGKSLDDLLSALDTLEDSEERDWLAYNLTPLAKNALSQNSDWAERSRYKSTYRGGEKLNLLSGMYTDTGFDDIDYDYINRNEEARGRALVNSIADNTALLGLDNSYLKEMTDDEILVYNYLYDPNDKTASDAYLAILLSDLNYRQRESNTKYWADYAKEHPVLSSTFSVLISPMKGLSAIGQIADYADDGKIDQNAAYNKFSYAPAAIREQVSSDIANSGKWGEVGSWTYQLGMSMGDFLVNSAVSGGNSALSLTLMGSGAMADTVISAKDRGLSDDQAMILGVVAAGAEIVTEKFSLDALFKGDMSKGAMRYILTNAFTEGSEEVGSSLINTIADVLVSKDKSMWQMEINEYLAKHPGATEQEAFQKVLGDNLLSLGLDFLGGALMGGTMGTGGAGINTIMQNNYSKNTYGSSQQELVGEALEIDPDNAFAQRMQGRLDSGKNLSGSQLNRLVQQNEKALTAQDKSTIQSAAEARLTELGETGDVAAIAAALTKQAAGEKLSKSEQRIIAESKYGQRVANELNTENIRSGEYASAWAENIGTERINVEEYSRLVEAAQQPQETAETAGGKIVTNTPEAAQTQQAAPVVAPAANDQQMTGKLTGSESAQVTEESPETEEVETETVTLEDVSKKYGAQAQAMIHTYVVGQDVAKYDQGYQAAYDMGKAGVAFSYLEKSEAVSYLTDNQKQLAYEAGQAASDTAAKDLDAKHKATANGKTGRKKGVVRGEGVTISDLKETFNDTQGKAYKYLSAVAEVTGIDIVLYRSEAGADGKFQGAQGRYSRSEPGTIYIDLNAGLSDIKSADDLAKYAMLRTFSHEFTHFLENWNPIQYNELRKVVFDTLTERGKNVHDLIEDKQAQEPGMSYDKASREVVAEAMTDVLPDANFVQELAEKHRTVFQKLLDKLKEFVENLRDYFNSIGHNPSREANALKEQVGDTIKYMDSIVQLFDKVAVQAVENYQQSVAAEEVALDSERNDDVQYQGRNRQKYSYKNISRQEYRQIQEDRMEKYGDHFDEMPVIDYTHAHDQLYVFENFDETRFGVLEIIDPAKNKTKADIVVEAFDNGPVQNIQDLNGRITRLRNFQKLRSVYHSNARNGGTGTGNAGLGAGFGGASNRNGMPGDGNGNKAQHQQRTNTLTDREVLVMAAEHVAVDGLIATEKDALRVFQRRLVDLEKRQKQVREQQEELKRQQEQKASAIEIQKTKNRIAVLEEGAKRESQKLAELEKVPILQQLLGKARPAVEAKLLAERKARLEAFRKQYGTIPSGEKAVRPDDLPRATNDENRVSYTARTVKGAKVTPDDFADLIDAEVAEGGLTYLPISNNAVTKEAIHYIQQEGWEAARYRWSADVRRGMASAKMSAVGALLLNNAAKAGDKTAWLEILSDYRLMGTRAAQATQALRILKTLTPTDNLYMVEKAVEKMVRDLHLEGEVEIDKDLLKAYQTAKTDKQRDAAITEIQKSIAKQLPSTMMEMWTALRYVNMLGNFKTQIRNVLGNVAMSLTNRIKNMIATGLEKLAYKASKGSFKRTKSLMVGKELLRACKADFAEIESLALDGGKYADAATSRLEKGIRDEKRVFKAPSFVKNEIAKKIVDALLTPMEKYRQATTWAMEEGDLLFSKSAYARALGGYLKANGVRSADLSKCDEALLDEARMYAIKEAQEVTFRDHNALTEILTSKLEERSGIAKIVNTAAHGIMPFRQTPANVLLRAEEYSPLGLINSLVLSLQAAAGKSNLTQKKNLIGEFARGGQEITGAQLINSFSKTLTGMVLFLAGMILSNLGFAVGGEDEDEKKETFDKLNGKQNFSLKICGVYYTLDWLSPSAIPFFMGVNLMEQMKENGISAESIKDSLMSLTTPMLQMSMLQGLNDTLDEVRYSNSPLLQFGENALFSYAVQGMTNSLISHLERGFEDKRYTTYVDKNSDVDTDLQKKLGKNSAKIPGWDYNQVPYINAWGEKEGNPGTVVNLAYNLFSPGYFSKDSTDDVAKELYRLNEVNEAERGVFPKTPEKTATFTDSQGAKHKDYDLSPKEYVELAKVHGQTQRRIVEELFTSEGYKALTDEQKVKAVHKAYDYAREFAQIEVLDRDGFSAKWMAGIEGKEAQTIIQRVSEK